MCDYVGMSRYRVMILYLRVTFKFKNANKCIEMLCATCSWILVKEMIYMIRSK